MTTPELKCSGCGCIEQFESPKEETPPEPLGPGHQTAEPPA